MRRIGLHNANWQTFNVRLGLRATLAVLLGLVLGEWLDLAGEVLTLSALYASLVGLGSPVRLRMVTVLGFTILLSGVTAVAWAVAGEMWPTVLAVLVVVFLASSMMAFGPSMALEGGLLSAWLTIWLGGFGMETIGQSVVATALGGLSVMVMSLVFAWIASARRPATVASTTSAPHAPPTTAYERPRLTWTSEIAEYASARAVATSVATLVGWLIIGAHPFWVTFGSLMVIKPTHVDTYKAVTNRLIGTIAGGIVGGLLITPLGDDSAIIAILSIGTIFLMAATSVGVNYSIFVFFLTLNVILSGLSPASGAGSLSATRVVATIIGVAIALGVVAISDRVWKQDNPDATALEGGASQLDQPS